eukprot:6293604-Amphidinium_carterae.1
MAQQCVRQWVRHVKILRVDQSYAAYAAAIGAVAATPAQVLAKAESTGPMHSVCIHCEHSRILDCSNVGSSGHLKCALHAAALDAHAYAHCCSPIGLPLLICEEDEDDGFDVRFLVVLALPLGAATWALFNVWRVAFRQVTAATPTQSSSIVSSTVSF